MQSPYDPRERASRIRKAFYAMTQYQPTIARIVMNTPRLKQSYFALLTAGILTFLIATLTVGYTVAVSGLTVGGGVASVIGVLLVYLLPNDAVIGTILICASILLGQVTGTIPYMPAPVLYSGLTSGFIITIGAGAYLTRHVVFIGSALWEQEMAEPIGDDSSIEP